MKITQIAVAGILLLLVAAGFLLMDAENDKKNNALQTKMDAMAETLKQLRTPPPAPAPAPAPEVVVAPTEVAVPPGAAAQNIGTPPTVPGTSPDGATKQASAALDIAAKEKILLDEQLAILSEKTAPKQYSPLQTKIKNLPAIAKIKAYQAAEGFVVLDAGKNRNLEQGMVFNIRRDAMLVGRVKVADTVEDAESVADVDAKSVPPGIELKAGDELVQYE